MFGLLNATPSRAQSQAVATSLGAQVYESVWIKPDKPAGADIIRQVMFSLNDGSFTARGIPLQMLIRLAYNVQDSQLSGGPDWLNSERYDIEAKLDSSAVAELSKLSPDQLDRENQRRLQGLLNDHFKLAAHSETQLRPVYDLVVANNGPKLQESKRARMLRRMGRGDLESGGIPMALLADELSRRLGTTVVDKTGLKGNYIFHLKWTPDAAEDARLKDEGGPQGAPLLPEASGPSLITAVQEQLGLKLEWQTHPVQVLVIDHAETPSEN
jgi:uncharacterized protein (TIGR03435 family)